jgi:hypothetical protein
VPKRIFSYEQAAALLPEVARITSEAVERLALVAANDAPIESEDPAEYERVVTEWAESILDMGVEVKGLWLVDFDNGGGYYCWKHPEPALEYFHGYEEGFGGRVKLN